ncbi:MAG: pantetheine-phosphate adenylyltransferase [Chloroflexota bacterium]
MTVAVYPGSFDPITNGHLDIARRAARIFDRLVVAVYNTPPKNVLFTTNQRVAMAQAALSDVANVSVEPFTGLTVEFARRVGATVLVRGLRAISDFEMEYQMASMNRELAPEMEVVCLMTSIQYSFLSSSTLKEIAKLGGSVDDMVPAAVAEALRERYARDGEPPPVPRYLST